MALGISDDDLRSLVRDAVARHGGRETDPLPRPTASPHASHARLTVVKGGDADGRCLIEPAVMCNHCGYCQSMGH